ncbi:MAG: hypothetical protein M3083_00040 [Actinomycetota bacterium]|nr:hypothetical protein [Actinomycetota bacterium]MDQ6946611.1 hypothetical protein [Actinomycetota bacterium]
MPIEPSLLNVTATSKADHLVLYRPGTGVISMVKESRGLFSAVYAHADPRPGIAGYDRKSPDDRVFAFDYASNGSIDHLVLYRPGNGVIWIVKETWRA